MKKSLLMLGSPIVPHSHPSPRPLPHLSGNLHLFLASPPLHLLLLVLQALLLFFAYVLHPLVPDPLPMCFLCQLCMLFPLFQPVAAALPPGSQPPDTSTGTSGEALACVTTTLTQELSGHYVLHTNMYHRFVPLRQYSIVVRTQTLGSNPGPVSYLATRSWTNI